MGKLFPLSFLIHGLISLIAQIVILRELMIALYGNELFMASTLGFWLLGAGLGSWLTHRLFTRKISLQRLLVLDLLLITFTIPAEIFLIRFFKGRLFLPGEIPNFLVGLGLSFVLLFPFCFLLNAFFTLATRFLSQTKEKEDKKKSLPQLISSAYFWETLGLVLGGLLFNFFLINLPEFKITVLLSGVSLLLSCSFTQNPWLKASTIALALLVILLAFSPFSSILNQQTLKLIQPDLLEAVNTKYGRVTVARSVGQYNFFESGSLVGIEQDFEISEYLAHFVLNFHPSPQKILLIGGGFNGVISEMLKYQAVKKIDYVELDPLFLKTVKKYLPQKLQEALSNPKVKINYLDGRKFLKETGEKYDLVIFLLPNPSSTLINRFFTQECFQEVKNRLNQEGIFVFSLSVPVDYLSREAEKLTSSLYWTTKSIFPEVLVFPEANSLFLASSQPLAKEAEFITDRFKKADIKTDFITSEYFSYRTKSDHISHFEQIFQENQNVKINLDFSPSAYFYQIAFWQTQSSFVTAKAFEGLVKYKPLFFVLPLTLLLGLLLKKPSSQQRAILWVALAGFTLMTLETLIIFTFQATLGFIFTKTGLLFTAILVSMAGGNFLATKHLSLAPKILKTISLGIILYCFLFLNLISKTPSPFTFYFLSALIGLLIGTVFPLANQIYLQKNNQGHLKTGVLYSADLGGAFWGAILTSLFFIPILGVQTTVYLIVAANLLFLIFPIQFFIKSLS